MGFRIWLNRKSNPDFFALRHIPHVRENFKALTFKIGGGLGVERLDMKPQIYFRL